MSIYLNFFEISVATLLPLWMLASIVRQSIAFAKQGISLVGRPPIHKILFRSAKYLILPVWLLPMVQSWSIDLRWVALPDTWVALALSIWVAGFLLMFAGYRAMEQSLRMGIPREETTLKTDGLFRFSRNPMYLGLFLTMLGSSVYTANLIIMLCGGLVVGLHLAIIAAEERMLTERFGNQYIEYKSRVPRLVPGLPRTIHRGSAEPSRGG